jgi:voltage-gated potassium channel
VARRWVPQGVSLPGREAETDESTHVLMPSRALNPAWQIAIRVAIAVGALFVTAIIVYLERDCYDDNGVAGAITFIDALYYATVSLSTTGYGDIAPICESSRLVNIIVITPLRFLFLIVLIGTTVEYLTKRGRDDFRRNQWRKHVNNHTVIIGFGVKGRSAAKMLIDSGMPRKEIVVVARDRDGVNEAQRLGLVTVEGDGRRTAILNDAMVSRAKQVIVATDEDDTSVLVTLTVRRLAPAAEIVSAVREAENAEILRGAGADNVIQTAESAGNLMALTLISPEAGDLMEDLLESGRGLEIVQRLITKEELGIAPHEVNASGEIVLAIVRDGDMHRFHEHRVRILEKNDELVVIREAQGNPVTPRDSGREGSFED